MNSLNQPLKKAEKQPFVSVVIPTYNAARFLPATVGSVYAQTYQNFEIIVVDDASTDHTASLFDEAAAQPNQQAFSFDQRLKYIRLKTNCGGPAEPRNVGVAEARGEYIAFLDADDLWHVDKLNTQIEIMLSHKLDFTSVEKILFTEDFEVEPIRNKKELSNTDTQNLGIQLSYKKLLQKNIVNTSGVCVRAALIKKYKFDSQKNYIAVEDFDMWLRMHKEQKLKSYILPRYTLFYRRNASGISKAKIKMAKKVWGLLGSKEFNLSLNSRVYNFMCYATKSLMKTI